MSSKYIMQSRLVSVKSEETNIKKMHITDPEIAANYARSFYNEDIDLYESFFIITMNRKNIVDSYAKISQGGVAGTVVDIKIIAKYAIDSLSSGVILIHNHPSGNVQPSNTDINLTKNINNGLKLLDITLFDHIIITESEYYSLKNEGLF